MSEQMPLSPRKAARAHDVTDPSGARQVRGGANATSDNASRVTNRHSEAGFLGRSQKLICHLSGGAL